MLLRALTIPGCYVLAIIDLQRVFLCHAFPNSCFRMFAAVGKLEQSAQPFIESRMKVALILFLNGVEDLLAALI
jgi:hypothetical protein